MANNMNKRTTKQIILKNIKTKRMLIKEIDL